MIRSFKDRHTALAFEGKFTKRVPPDLRKRVAAKLAQVDAATLVESLRLPPSNHLEHLRGDRAGQYSIRINDQWRICFKWSAGDAYEVEFTDYH